MVVAAVLILAIGSVGSIWIFSDYQRYQDSFDQWGQEYIRARKLEAKALIDNVIEDIEFRKNGVEQELKTDLAEYADLALKIANAVYSGFRDRLPEAELRRLVIESLMPLRFFDGRGYFWIHDRNHVLIAHPFRSKSIGQNDSEVTDSNGQKIVRSFVTTALKNPLGGYVAYYWTKPGVDERYHREKGQKKIAYVTYFEPFEWVIGIGEYVEDVEEQIQQEVIDRLNSIRHGEKGYIFAHTSDGICLSHVNQDNIGKDRWELLDASGLKVVQELDRVGRRPGGDFLEYISSVNPETGKAARKISFVRAVPDWGWVLGSGVYLADIELSMARNRDQLRHVLERNILSTLFVLGLVMVAGYLVGRLLFKGLLREIDLFAGEVTDMDIRRIDPGNFRITELRSIIEHTNDLLEEKERIQNDLHQAKRMESIGVLAGGVAHDLNNILAGIVGYPELLLRKLPPDSELRLPLEAIQDSGRRAAMVVADLLTVARSVARVWELYDLNSLVRECCESPEFKRLEADYPRVAFVQRIEASTAVVRCSPVHLKKSLLNLVMNGAEAVEGDGEVTVATMNRSVEGVGDGIPGQLDPGFYLVLEVTDTGAGISDNDLVHIFEPFYSRKIMGRSGTGLGLTVVWNTVRDHGGGVTVDSGSGGSRFRLFFPVARESGAGEGGRTEEDYRAPHAAHVLVVDDELQVRNLAAHMLEALGYSVSSVGSGEEAVDYVRNHDVDLVLLDMIMEPGLNGRQTYQKILSIRPGIRAVIASGFSESEEVRQALRLGAACFLAKPYSLEQLGRAVKEALLSVGPEHQ